MDKLKAFFGTSLLGGVTVILPVAILFAVFGWIFNFVTGLIKPLTNLVVSKSDVREIIAVVIVLVLILVTCFLVGAVFRTRLGGFLYGIFEHKILKVAPGYNLIKETVLQILGSKKSLFSTVALAQIFENNTLVTAFVTDEDDENGMCSVFVPTGPNPTSGVIYHLHKKYVHPVDISVEEAMRTIISCGAGSAKLLKAKRKK